MMRMRRRRRRRRMLCMLLHGADAEVEPWTASRISQLTTSELR
jgi:hypothetical protein